MASINIIFLTLILYYTSINYTEAKLHSVAIIFRHGDRNPALLYPKLQQTEYADKWKQSELGQLTELGKLRCRSLGQYLVKLYGNNGQLKSNENIFLASSPIQRCQDSLRYFLDEFTESNDSLPEVIVHPWYSIEAACSKRKELLLHPPFEAAEIAKHQALFRYIDHHFGFKLNSALLRSFMALDFYKTMKEQGLEPPAWITEGIKDTLLKFNLRFIENASKNDELLKLAVGSTLNDLNSLFNGTFKSKFYIQATHDVNLVFIFNMLGISLNSFPQYSSSLIFELHKDSEGENIKFYTIEDPFEPLMKPLKPYFCPNETICPLETFYRETNKFNFQGNWSEECQVDGVTEGKSLLQFNVTK